MGIADETGDWMVAHEDGARELCSLSQEDEGASSSAL